MYVLSMYVCTLYVLCMYVISMGREWDDNWMGWDGSFCQKYMMNVKCELIWYTNAMKQ